MERIGEVISTFEINVKEIASKNIIAENNVDEITRKMQDMKIVEEVEQILNETTIVIEQKVQQILEEEALTDELENLSLSQATKNAIDGTSGPLSPEDLKKFLLEDAFGKPRPKVLFISRKYTSETANLIQQLTSIANENETVHKRYMSEQRRLDINLNRRISTLAANLTAELARERIGGLSQQSMDQYVYRNVP